MASSTMKHLFQQMVGLLALFTVSPALSAGGHPSAQVCEKKFAAASELLRAGKLELAATESAKGYALCGPGWGFLSMQGVIYGQQGKFDEAVALLLQEVSEPQPRPELFRSLERFRDKASNEARTRIATMGSSSAHPVYVFGAIGEQSWAKAFACLGSKTLHGLRRSTTAAPVAPSASRKKSPGLPIDMLEFTCEDGVRHKVYFNPGQADAPAFSPR